MKTKIKLPKEMYHQEKRNGKIVTVCTLRQIVCHTIGLDDDSARGRHRPYTRHGKKFYRPWRNYFCTFPDDKTWVELCNAGYAEHGKIKEHNDGTKSCTFWLTRAGLDWLGTELGITIHNEED